MVERVCSGQQAAGGSVSGGWECSGLPIKLLTVRIKWVEFLQWS